MAAKRKSIQIRISEEYKNDLDILYRHEYRRGYPRINRDGKYIPLSYNGYIEFIIRIFLQNNENSIKEWKLYEATKAKNSYDWTEFHGTKTI